MPELKTVWGENLNPEAILPEYPRPQLVRENYVNLNGRWDYAITASGAEPEHWDGEILVPFSPEAPLSGVNRTLLPGQTLWYRREIAEIRREGQRLLLHFGAIDQEAKIYVNGKLAGAHLGGYTAFTVELTEFLTDGPSVLTVAVRDGTDTNEYCRGKQKTKRGGIWYTPQSGIWQTVWMEWVPQSYITGLRLTPDAANGCVRVVVQAEENRACYLHFAGRRVGAFTNRECVLRVEAPELWTPEHPKLYEFSAELGEDRVESYFALRDIGIGRDAAGHPCLTLNGKPVFHTGVLDQGYWPDGLYTAPSDEALVWDIRTMKNLGFNMLRKHIKVEPMRWYYHCDRLGMLVWQDMPNGGGKYDLMTISAPLITRRHKKDNDYKRFARTDAAGRAEYYAGLDEMVRQLYNCPSIVMWVPFNEGWGQFDAAEAVRRIRALDQTRTIDHASGWHDQGAGDVQSLHVYFYQYRFRPDKRGRAVVLSEFGGYNLPLVGHTWNDANFGYRGYKTPEALEAAYRKLYETQIIPAKEKGLAACVYTQLSDVEDEVNGLVTYDRRVVKMPVSAPFALNAQLKRERVDFLIPL